MAVLISLTREESSMVAVVSLKSWARSGAIMEIVGLFSSHMIFVATSIGLRACTTCSAFEMSVSVRVQMSLVLFLTSMKEHRQTEWNFH